MKTFTFLVLTVLSLSFVESTHLVVGNVANRVTLAYNEKVQYNAVPFFKRVKQFFYTSPTNKRIKGIQALDLDHSKASINITAGGVGFPFVNMRLKSERGRGLNYNIGIYICDEFLNPGTSYQACENS